MPRKLLPPMPAWMADANCRGVDPEPFFPARGESSRSARAVCGGCTVRAERLVCALDQQELGVARVAEAHDAGVRAMDAFDAAARAEPRVPDDE